IYAASVATDPLDAAAPAELPPDPFERAAESPPEDAVAARRSLQGQIARLEAQLAPFPGKGSTEDDTEQPRIPAPPHVADLAELEASRDRLIERLKQARLAAERQGARYGAARGRLEQMVADPAAHKWEIVKREDVGEIGCGRYEVRPTFGPVGALMNWWRVKLSSGCP
ncbi:MAG: hypothetical protein ACRDL6_09700, partial [Solirubrobacterales bacterium]